MISMMKHFFIKILIIAFISSCTVHTKLYAQMDSFYFEFTAKKNKEKTIAALHQSIQTTLPLSFSDEHEKYWKSAFWAMSLMQYKPAELTQRLPTFIHQAPYYTAILQWTLLEGLFSLYPGEFAKEVEKVWQQFKTPKLKALALEYLRLGNIYPIIDDKSELFNNDYIQLYRQQLNQKSSSKLLTENDFLHKSFFAGETLLVSFQHKDRNKPGYLMIRTADGKWIKNASGNNYQFMQLARSITNMPFYLTNGNTPQGLFRLAGFEQSNNLWIGPSTNLQMVMPFEKGNSKEFFNTPEENPDSLYKQLLGPFGNYKYLWESYYAGKMGRSEIIAHGTTIPMEFYKNQPYYPCTPSLGCLCSPEWWDDSGKLIKSEQKEWIEVLQKNNLNPQYLLVVDID